MIFCTGYVVRYMNIKPDVQFNTKNVKNDNIDVKKQEQMQGYWTIAVFGVDSRDGGVGREPMRMCRLLFVLTGARER